MGYMQTAEHAAVLHKGTAAPDCTPGTCNPVNFTVLKPSDCKQGHKISIRVDEKVLDPRTLMLLKLVTVTHESSSYQVYHSFYEEIRSEFSISIRARNLFLSLVKSIAQTLNVTLCYVCRGTNLGDHWPRKVKELNLQESFNETAFPSHRKSTWLLKTYIIGNYCISCPKSQFSTLVGDLTCLGQKFYDDSAQETQWWRAPNHTEPQPHPLANFSALRKAWNNLPTNIDWQAPRGLSWICGKQAYRVLPSRWFGSCVLGTHNLGILYLAPTHTR
jgi:hypothetical protein